MPLRRACALAYGSALTSSLSVLALSGVLERRLGMVGGDDFSKIWAGPRALLTGHDPYDPITWHRAATELGTFPPDTAVYLYPPWVAVVLAPLGAMPLAVASAVWTVAGFAVASVSLFLLCRAFLPERPLAYASAATTLILSGPALSNLLTGQWGFLLVAAMAMVVLMLRSGRPIPAAAASLAMLAKPQLFLYAAPALALRALWPAPGRDRSAGVRYVLAASGAGLAVVIVSALLVPSWWPAWPTYVGNAQLVPESVTIPGLLFRAIGTPGLVLAVAVLLGAVVVALRIHPRSPAWIPVWLSLSIAATPYSNPYDLLVLIVPLVVAAGALTRCSTTRALVVLYAGAALLLFGETALHDLALLAYAPLVPASMFVLITVALWPQRSSADPEGV